jgi:hypothetical protein
MSVKSVAQNLLNEYGQDLFPLGRNWEVLFYSPRQS